MHKTGKTGEDWEDGRRRLSPDCRVVGSCRVAVGDCRGAVGLSGVGSCRVLSGLVRLGRGVRTCQVCRVLSGAVGCCRVVGLSGVGCQVYIYILHGNADPNTLSRLARVHPTIHPSIHKVCHLKGRASSQGYSFSSTFVMCSIRQSQAHSHCQHHQHRQHRHTIHSQSMSLGG